MRGLSIKEYAKKLSLFHALSKTHIKSSKPIKAILHECKNKLIYTKDEYYFLPKDVRFMIITKLEKTSKTDAKTLYKLMLTEAFFTMSYKKLKTHKKDSIKKDSIRIKPYIYFVTLTSKKTFQIYDLLLIKIKKDYTKYQEIQKNNYKKVMRLELHYKHSLHNIINNNLHYANNQYVTKYRKNIEKDSKKQAQKSSEKHICMITENKNKVVAQALNTRMIIPIKATQKALKGLPKFTLIAVNENNEITEVLGSLTQGKLDKEISLYINNYTPKDFNQKALNEAENIIKSLNNIESIKLPKNHIKKQLNGSFRYDLTHFPFCTIDPVNARDHDDAIYYDSKHSILYVAIADVSSYVLMDSTLDKEAKHRAFSLYFPNKVFPMLPPQLSNNACSLRQNEKRLALVWALKLHKRNAKVLNAQIFKALICSKASLNYNQVSYLLESKQDSKNFAQHHNKILLESNIESKPINNKAIEESLIKFSKLAILLYKKRMQNGIDLALRDFSIQVDDNEKIDSINIEKKDISHTIIEEAMLLANQASAMYLHDIKHGIYRNHAKPNQKDFYKLLSILSNMNINTKNITLYKSNKKHKEQNNMIACLQVLQKKAIKQNKRHIVDFCIVRHFTKANYMCNNVGHFGLGFSFYTHFTSPIRRYSDLLTHRLITAHLQNDTKALGYIMREANNTLAHINKREVQFDSIESYYKRLKMLRYAQGLLPFNDEALIFMVRKNTAYGFPLHKIGYCSVEINCKDCIINTHEVIQIQIIEVDFNTLSLKAELIRKTKK